MNTLTYCAREKHQLFWDKKAKKLFRQYLFVFIEQIQNGTKLFRSSKTITEIDITGLSHDNSCIQTDLCRLQRKKPLFISLSLCLDLSRSLYLSLFPLCKIFLKRRGCLLNHQFQRVPFLFCQPQVIFTPTLHLPVPPPIHPSLSKRTLCANLYSLSHAKHLSCPH